MSRVTFFGEKKMCTSSPFDKGEKGVLDMNKYGRYGVRGEGTPVLLVWIRRRANIQKKYRVDYSFYVYRYCVHTRIEIFIKKKKKYEICYREWKKKKFETAYNIINIIIVCVYDIVIHTRAYAEELIFVWKIKCG